MDTWRLLPFRRYDPFENMAIDEALFRVHQQEGGSPVLRFFGWKDPAVSLGYFQDVEAEINGEYCRDKGIKIVRRPTGGKGVLHGGDLTYSLVARENTPLFSPDIIETYRTVSRCLIRGLDRSGVAVEIVKEGRGGSGPGGGFCFTTPYKNEILAGGRKICGSAQIRARGVFLQHGSVLIDFDLHTACAAMGKRGDPNLKALKIASAVTSVRETVGKDIGIDTLCRNIRAGFEEILQVRLVEGALSPEEEALKARLLEEKYHSDEWNMKGRGGRGY